MGRHHLGALARGRSWTLTGIVDSHQGLERLAPTVRQGSDLRGLLGELRPDAAIVAVPPSSHDEVARICLEAGCHVLLEKPICPSHAMARRLADEVRGQGMVLFGGHSERFHPVFAALKAQLPRLGAIQRIETLRQGPKPPRVGEGGVVFDLAIHDLDLIVRMVHSPIRVIGAHRLHDAPSGNGGDSVCAELEWSSGSVTVRSSWNPSRRRQIRVVGTNGELEADFLAPSLVFFDARGVWRQELPNFDPLETEHAAFRAACEGKFDAVADLEPQIEALRLAERILRARDPRI